MLSLATLAFSFSSCKTMDSNPAANANKPNNAVVVNSNQTAVNKMTPAPDTAPGSANNSAANKSSTAVTPAADTEASKIQGELQVGKTESLILYVGMESGDYAAYCFANESEAGRAILAACKDKGQCEVTGTTGSGKCEVPGLEADLSDSGRITKVVSAKPLAGKR